MTPEQDTNEPHVRLTITDDGGRSIRPPEWFRPSEFQSALAFAASVEETLGKRPDCQHKWKVSETRGFDENPIHHEETLSKIWRMAMAISVAFVAAECRSPEEARDIAKDPRWPDHWRAVLQSYQGVFEVGEYASDRVSQQADRHALGPYLDYVDWTRLEQDMQKHGRIVAVIADGERHVFSSLDVA